MWTGGDVSARYERVKNAAQRRADQVKDKTLDTQFSPVASAVQDDRPYQNELRDAVELRTVPIEYQQPLLLAGKAEQQAAGSREQVLEDSQNGGNQILFEEAQEEKEARSMIRKSNRRRTASSLTQSDSLRGLRERVTMHGRTGGILGMESSR